MALEAVGRITMEKQHFSLCGQDSNLSFSGQMLGIVWKVRFDFEECNSKNSYHVTSLMH